MKKRKAIRRALRMPFEWVGIGLGVVLFASVPHRLVILLADVIARVMYLCDGRGRRRSLANLRIVVRSRSRATRCTSAEEAGMIAPSWNPTRRERVIILRSYRNMARTVAYAFHTMLFARARARAAGEMSQPCKDFLAAHRPCVTVSGHIGCWEILSQLAFLEGHRMVSVAKDIGTKGMTALLMRSRRSIGQEIVPAEGAFKPLMHALKDGASLGLLVDQAVRPKDGGLWVRFFGVPVPVSAAPAFFAAKGRADVILAWSRPLKDGRWRCEKIAAYESREARDIRGFTQRCILDLERIIRRHPSCWVLNYNVFRKRPTAEEAEELP